jgi:methylmalonyl-CoA mutase N-terminal domain/subunit
LALVADVIRFCCEQVPGWNPISISGYHIREAGATAVQELAFTFANAIEYVTRSIAAGVAVERFAPRLSYFFAAHSDLFEEVAKFRAARRIYARLMRDRFGASEASCRLRFHTQTGGVTLTAQQPLNNVVRVAVQSLAATLGGTQSLHTNGYDEALALPSVEAATLALRTQQIIAYESGVANTADPLAGSYYVEHLTAELERRAAAVLTRVDELGGAVAAIERGFVQEEIGRSAYEYQLAVERGERPIVGVNCFTDASEPLGIQNPDYAALARDQLARLTAVKAARDGQRVRTALERLRLAAKAYAASGVSSQAPVPGFPDSRKPLMPLIIDVVRARGSVGEIADALSQAWGTYRPAA